MYFPRLQWKGWKDNGVNSCVALSQETAIWLHFSSLEKLSTQRINPSSRQFSPVFTIALRLLCYCMNNLALTFNSLEYPDERVSDNANHYFFFFGSDRLRLSRTGFPLIILNSRFTIIPLPEDKIFAYIWSTVIFFCVALRLASRLFGQYSMMLLLSFLLL